MYCRTYIATSKMEWYIFFLCAIVRNSETRLTVYSTELFKLLCLFHLCMNKQMYMICSTMNKRTMVEVAFLETTKTTKRGWRRRSWSVLSGYICPGLWYGILFRGDSNEMNWGFCLINYIQHIYFKWCSLLWFQREIERESIIVYR